MDETDDPEALWRLKEPEAIDAVRRRFTLAEALSAPRGGAEHVLRAQAAAARGRGAARHRLRAGDGDSKFMACFKDECRKRGLPLLVLPPRSPQLNGIGRCLL